MTDRPSADDLKRLWNLSEMPTERVFFRQSYVDPKAGSAGSESNAQFCLGLFPHLDVMGAVAIRPQSARCSALGCDLGSAR